MNIKNLLNIIPLLFEHYLSFLNNESLSFKIILYKFRCHMIKHNFFVKFLIKINQFINSLLRKKFKQIKRR